MYKAFPYPPSDTLILLMCPEEILFTSHPSFPWVLISMPKWKWVFLGSPKVPDRENGMSRGEIKSVLFCPHKKNAIWMTTVEQISFVFISKGSTLTKIHFLIVYVQIIRKCLFKKYLKIINLLKYNPDPVWYQRTHLYNGF